MMAFQGACRLEKVHDFFFQQVEFTSSDDDSLLIHSVSGKPRCENEIMSSTVLKATGNIDIHWFGKCFLFDKILKISRN